MMLSHKLTVEVLTRSQLMTENILVAALHLLSSGKGNGTLPNVQKDINLSCHMSILETVPYNLFQF